MKIEQLKYPEFRSLVDKALLRHGISLDAILNEKPPAPAPEPKHYSVFVKNGNGTYYFVFRSASKIDGEIVPGRIEWVSKKDQATQFLKPDAERVASEIQKDCPSDQVQIEGNDFVNHGLGVIGQYDLNEVLYRR